MWMAIRSCLPADSSHCLLSVFCGQKALITHLPIVHLVWKCGFFSSKRLALISSWNLRMIPKKVRVLWKLIYPAVCWEIQLERNQRVFERHTKPALNMYLNAKDLVCFQVINWGLGGNYSGAWPNLFLCNQLFFSCCLLLQCFSLPLGFLIPFLLMKFHL